MCGKKDNSVAVIIPTRKRAGLLMRALESVFAQSFPPQEIIVVIDGPCEETRAALTAIPRADITVLELGAPSGACIARNYAIAQSRSRWIALLDDDDEWLPQKLEKQILAADASGHTYPMVFSKVVVRTPAGDFSAPRRGPAAGEKIPEYLFCRKTLRPWEVLMQSSNLLSSRELFQRVPFTPGLRKWDDTDWLMRAAQMAGTELVFVNELLSIWYLDESRSTLSTTLNWEYLFDWVKSNRALFPEHAYSGALLSSVAREAMKQGCRNACWPILQEALRRGRPSMLQLMAFGLATGATWLLPKKLLSRVREAAR